MAKHFFKKYIPTPEKVKNNPSLKFLSPLFSRSWLWHLNRRSVAKACFVGIFVAFIPMPMQMALAAILAVFANANIPVSVALVWISNPVTMPPMFYATYRFGVWLLNMQEQPFEFELSFEWILQGLGNLWLPLYLGSLTVGLILAIVAFFGVRIFWRISVIKRWQQRQQARAN